MNRDAAGSWRDTGDTFNSLRPDDAYYMRHWTGSSLDQIMDGCLFGTKPSSEPVLTYSLLYPGQGTYFNAILFEIEKFPFKKLHLKMWSAKWWPFVLVSMG